MDKKYEVFISSTYVDLQKERKKIREILLAAECIPAGMETFVATDDDQFNVIKKTIDLCDYFILLIGNRYGSINPKTGISYTEMEYEYAREKGIPVLVFAIDEQVSKKLGMPDNPAKLKNFRDKAMCNRLACIWKNESDLLQEVTLSISAAKKDNPRQGWTRAQEQERNRKEYHNIPLAFEDGVIEIQYQYTDINFADTTIRQGTYIANFKDIFSYVSITMVNPTISEETFEDSIEQYLSLRTGHSCCHYENNLQITKRILAQYQNLNLIEHVWSGRNQKIYWRLTELGKRLRTELALIKK